LSLDAEVKAAVDEWLLHPLPRPPLPPQAVLLFVCDWPAVPFLNPRCNLCGRGVRRALLIAHMAAVHPGWAEAWNAALLSEGIVK
jgi:hypothetical protein